MTGSARQWRKGSTCAGTWHRLSSCYMQMVREKIAPPNPSVDQELNHLLMDEPDIIHGDINLKMSSYSRIATASLEQGWQTSDIRPSTLPVSAFIHQTLNLGRRLSTITGGFLPC